jgi:CelD/BcsL family acetyltransferase involved in cellulose biosynthesis
MRRELLNTNFMVPPSSDSTRLVRIDLDDAAWLDFVSRDPQALPFHHGAWARMLAECYAFSSFGLALKTTPGRLLAGVPIVETRGLLRSRRWISLPFTDFCPPLAGDDPFLEAHLGDQLDEARREAGIRSLELRSAPTSKNALAVPRGLRHTLALEADPEATFSRFKPNVRNKIRSAGRSAVSVARAEQEADLTTTFYELHTATRRRLGVPVQPRRYFSLLWRRVLEPGLGFVLVARAGKQSVAAAVFLAWGDTVVYKYGASDGAGSRLRANNAILWHAIAWACMNGYSVFDFGRTDFASKGLQEFKRGWGTEETSLTYTLRGPSKASGSDAGRMARLMQPFIRRAPTFVCRGIGRALYRYAA